MSGRCARHRAFPQLPPFCKAADPAAGRGCFGVTEPAKGTLELRLGAQGIALPDHCAAQPSRCPELPMERGPNSGLPS